MTDRLLRLASGISESLLAEITSSLGATTASQVAMLNDLKRYAIAIRKSYMTQSVKADYRLPEVQAAYLLRHFVPYTLPINKLMLDSVHRFANPRPTVCLIGAGPAPEAIGLLSAIAETQAHVEEITFHLVDKEADGWRFARNITCGPVAARVAPAITKNWHSQARNLAAEKAPTARFDLLVFQNCLNEIVHTGFSTDLLESWTDCVLPGGYLALIDRSGYPSVMAFVNREAGTLIQKGWELKCEVDDAQLDLRPFNHHVARPVLDHLYLFNPYPWTSGGDSNHLRLASRLNYFAYLLKKPV